ncbi:hypothetical protein CCAN2_2060014 [Capnocytophaga canimorsus]|nr:hypothetical protein CCAN2_2060007 [Capnocytophaga canimorsus]CEN50710.1 hypothetical protein CCAN2_2060014 [Capnocytophaga canimorsus]
MLFYFSNLLFDILLLPIPHCLIYIALTKKHPPTPLQRGNCATIL